jgi:hypothetical protein
VKIPTASSTTDTRSETDFHIWGWRNVLAMTIYFLIRCTKLIGDKIFIFSSSVKNIHRILSDIQHTLIVTCLF